MIWLRARFEANLEDSRPVIFPPPGPYWETGFNDKHAIVVAYVLHERDVTRYWPEATNIEFEKRDEIKFTDRFPKPVWWNE